MTYLTACEVCGKGNDDRPAIFQGKPWCCDDHRKMITGEIPWPRPKG